MKKLIEVKLLRPEAKVPSYATDGSAGLDFYACFEKKDDYWFPIIEIAPGENALIPTGIAININDHSMAGVLASRSGIALNHRVRLGNGIGVIDSDYQKEVGLIIYNDANYPFIVNHGMKLAQLIFMPVYQVNLMVVEEFSTQSDRGGFGSTGV